MTKSQSKTKKVVTLQQDEISIRFKAEVPKVRYLKLKSFYRESRSKLLYKPPATIIPELRLCGSWLENAGFMPENYVSVTVMNGLILIRSAEEHSSE